MISIKSTFSTKSNSVIKSFIELIINSEVAMPCGHTTPIETGRRNSLRAATKYKVKNANSDSGISISKVSSKTLDACQTILYKELYLLFISFVKPFLMLILFLFDKPWVQYD